MLKTLGSTLESKKFVTAFLTTIAIAAAHFGLNVDVSLLLMLVSPIFVAIGAQGWADSGKEAAKINQDGENTRHAALMAMHAKALPLSAMLASDAPALSVVPPPQPKGFSVVELMVFLALGFGGTVVVASVHGCSSVKPVETNVIECAKAEGQAISSHFSIIQIVSEVIGAVETGDYLATVEKLIEKYGGEVVACVLDSMTSTPPGTEAHPKASLQEMRAKELLGRHFAGKKIVSAKKGN